MRPQSTLLAAAVLAGVLLPLPLPPVAAQGAAPSDSVAALVTGTVYDSSSNAPLAGALVQIIPRAATASAYSGFTDSSGTYRIPGVRSGRYLIGFMHPRLDSLGLGAPAHVVDIAGDSLHHINLAVPSGVTIRAQLCPAAAPGDSTGLALGFVRDADSGAPLPGAAVVVIWSELVIDRRGIRSERRELPAKANEQGWYAICGLPTDGSISARAELAQRASGFVELDVPPRGMLHVASATSSRARTSSAATRSSSPTCSSPSPACDPSTRRTASADSSSAPVAAVCAAPVRSWCISMESG